MRGPHGTPLPPLAGPWPQRDRRRWFFLRRIQLLALLLLWASALVAQVVPGHYIVELTGEAPAEVARQQTVARGRAARLRSARQYVHFQQRLLRKVIERYGGQPVASVDTVANALLVRMPARIAARLASVPGVRGVYPVRRMRMSLERAIPRHRVPEAWARIGGWDLAGAGVMIAILDSGIDVTHPGFVDPSIPMPEGFPRVNQPSDLAYTSNKVIVARSYLGLLGDQVDTSAADRLGHGTAVAMAAAGVPQSSADGPISGVAPEAYLGNYTVIGQDGTTRGDVVLKALDDAVRDGAGVINLSLGSPFAVRPPDDIFTRIVGRVTALGILVVVAAGNSGPEPFTVADFASAPAAITVGANWNDRTLGGKVVLSSGEQYSSVPGDGPRPNFPLNAPLFDISQLDSSGLACGSFPAGSLDGRIALIARGTCLFEDKLNNVQAAGAIGGLVYTDDRPVATMAVGSATLPAVMVSHEDGLAIKGLLGSSPDLTATIDFRVLEKVDPNRVAEFSSRGPNTDFSIKPDLLATGAALNTANLRGGFDTVYGTSFAAPIVSGAAAVLEAARPGYAGRQYRSLLINAAAPLVFKSGAPAPVQSMGAGVLDLDAALAGTTTAYPTSVSFGTTTGDFQRTLTITNLGANAETYTLTSQQFDGGPPPAFSVTSLAVPPRSAKTVTLTLSTIGLPPDEHQGFLWIRGTRPGTDIHVPYWYAIPSNTPVHLKIVWSEDGGKRGTLRQDAIAVRVTDAAGVPLNNTAPTVTVVSGGGSVRNVASSNDRYPGLFEASVWLGPEAGANVYRVKLGDLSQNVTIQGK